MTDHVQTNDFADIQDLMLTARRGALLSGPILVAAGSIYGAASLLVWTSSTGAIALAAPVQGWIWLAADAVFCPILYMQLVALRLAGSTRAASAAATTAGCSTQRAVCWRWPASPAPRRRPGRASPGIRWSSDTA